MLNIKTKKKLLIFPKKMEELLIKNALVLPVLDLAVDRYAAWKIWKAKWADYVLLTELNNKPDEYQCALLRYTFTSETRNIYDSLNLSEADSKKMNSVRSIRNFCKRCSK